MTGKEYGKQPAFPFEVTRGSEAVNHGMTIRDLFALGFACSLRVAGRGGSGYVADLAIAEADILCDRLAKEPT